LVVYKEILKISLYERYHSLANDLSCVITYNRKALCEAISRAKDITVHACEQVIRDLSRSSNGALNYDPFSDNYYLFPHCFTLKDGIGGILRLHASERSGKFSALCAGPIGAALVREVAGCFSEFRNFSVHTEVKLRQYDQGLPDIDCLENHLAGLPPPPWRRRG
jgi:hypothetical protein